MRERSRRVRGVRRRHNGSDMAHSERRERCRYWRQNTSCCRSRAAAPSAAGDAPRKGAREREMVMEGAMPFTNVSREQARLYCRCRRLLETFSLLIHAAMPPPILAHDIISMPYDAATPLRHIFETEYLDAEHIPSSRQYRHPLLLLSIIIMNNTALQLAHYQLARLLTVTPQVLHVITSFTHFQVNTFIVINVISAGRHQGIPRDCPDCYNNTNHHQLNTTTNINVLHH